MSRWFRPALCLSAFFWSSSVARAAIPLYRNGTDRSLELTVRVQLQYYRIGGEGWSEQDLFFRRLRPALEARLSRSWEAEAEFDFGSTIEGDAVEFKDLFLSYAGQDAKGLRFTFGNNKAVFSRQFQSSSKRLTLVDRGFVGIDDFGTLDRIVGARADYRNERHHIDLAASAGLASHEPDSDRMEFESPLNAADGANRGWVVAGRAEIEPRGDAAFDQGDFGSPELRFALGAAAYRWFNDGSQNRDSRAQPSLGPEPSDLNRARGVEVSGALRGRGLSADAELHWIHGDAVDPGYSGGLYRSGEASLTKLSVQSGYHVLRSRLEVVGGFDLLDAATYASAWKRVAMGGTVYCKEHRLKLQVNYLLHFAFFGVPGDDPQAIVTQLQLLF